MRYRILILNQLSARGLERLPPDLYEIGQRPYRPARGAGALGGPAQARVAEQRAGGRPGRRRHQQHPGCRTECARIPVFNTPGANANAVKELVLAGMLVAARNLCQAWDFARHLEGDDAAIDRAVEAGKKQFVGFELPGKTLGVIGLGAVGVEVANSALALGMRVLGYDPQLTVQRAWQLSSAVEQARSLDDLFARADMLSVHVPLADTTRQLVNAARLKLMRPGGVVLNFARAQIISEPDIVAALDAGQLRAYVCDFPSRLLKDHARVITLPHLGASTGEAEENCAVMAAEGLRDFLEHGNIRNSVNFSRIPAAAHAGHDAYSHRQQQRPEHGGPDLHLPGRRRH